MKDTTKTNLKEFFIAFFAYWKALDEFSESKAYLQTAKKGITARRISKPVWKPGDPCIVCSLGSSDECPKHQEGCACTDTSCRHREKSYIYCGALKLHDQSKSLFDEKFAYFKSALEQLVRS